MLTLVCGGRNYADRKFLYQFLDFRRASITQIITGAQRKWDPNRKEFVGADWLALEWAADHEVPFIGIPAQWSEYGDAAGPARNALMASDYKIKRCIAFPGHNGTRNMMAVAKAAGIPITTAGW